MSVKAASASARIASRGTTKHVLAHDTLDLHAVGDFPVRGLVLAQRKQRRVLIGRERVDGEGGVHGGVPGWVRDVRGTLYTLSRSSYALSRSSYARLTRVSMPNSGMARPHYRSDCIGKSAWIAGSSPAMTGAASTEASACAVATSEYPAATSSSANRCASHRRS